VIQREVSDPVALALLKGEFTDGDIVMVDASSDGELTFSSQHPVTAS
jgi:ATP-dependent Clp protease ATP-binding subunit ClpA